MPLASTTWTCTYFSEFLIQGWSSDTLSSLMEAVILIFVLQTNNFKILRPDKPSLQDLGQCFLILNLLIYLLSFWKHVKNKRLIWYLLFMNFVSFACTKEGYRCTSSIELELLQTLPSVTVKYKLHRSIFLLYKFKTHLL